MQALCRAYYPQFAATCPGGAMPKIAVRDMTTRWGSCSLRTGTLAFARRLCVACRCPRRNMLLCMSSAILPTPTTARRLGRGGGRLCRIKAANTTVKADVTNAPHPSLLHFYYALRRISRGIIRKKKYSTLVSNTLLFAISNFSSKLLSFFIRPYLSYALDTPDVMGVSSLLQQATNLLIPVVSLGVSYAVIRFGLDKQRSTNPASSSTARATISAGLFGAAAGHAAGAADPQCGGISGLIVPLCAGQLPAHAVYPVHPLPYAEPPGGDRRRADYRRCWLYYLLFLSGLKLGAAGFLLANACADLTSMVFVFIAGGCWRYFNPKAFDKTLWQDMLRYCLPMIPASISFWIINASDMFFVQGMCEAWRPQRQLLGRPAVGGVFPAADHHDSGQHLLRGMAALRCDRGTGPRGVLLQNFPRVCQRFVLLCGGRHLAVPADDARVQGRGYFDGWIVCAVSDALLDAAPA